MVTCEEFYDAYCGDLIDEFIQEYYYTKEGNFTETCLKLFLNEVKKQNVELIDLDSFDYDKFFYNIYKSTEKGLS